MFHIEGGTLEAPDVVGLFWCLWLWVAVQSVHRESSCSGHLWRCCTGSALHTSHQYTQVGNATPDTWNRTRGSQTHLSEIYLFTSWILSHVMVALMHLWPGSCWVPCSLQVEVGMAQEQQTRVLLKRPSSLGWRQSLLLRTPLYCMMKCLIALLHIVIYNQGWME